MAFVPAPNIVEAQLLFTLDGQLVENRVNIDVLTTPTPTIVADVANVVDNWCINNYLPYLPVEALYRGVIATDLTEHEGAQYTLVPEGSPAGTLTGGAMPNEVTLAIQLKSGSRGRSARGRAFVIALPRSQVDENTVSSGHIGHLVGAWQQLVTNVGTEGWELVVVSYITEGAPRSGGPVYFPILTCAVADAIVDSMRSRKPGVGT